MEERAYGKINLTLDILRRREDGFHDLRMVMQSVDLFDEITLNKREGEGIELSCDVGYVPSDGSNIAARAAEAFFRELGIRGEGLSIAIRKTIPVSAGMAGGSSDGAAVLRALGRMYRPDLPAERLEAIAAQVGSDVPYCVRGGTALAEGRGEILTDLPPLPPCWFVLCKPGFPISTPELFSRVRVKQLQFHPDTAGMLHSLETGDLEGICRRIYNVFEELLPRKYSRVLELKAALLDQGALAAAMTGTGPTVFGVFAGEEAARRAADVIGRVCGRVYVARPVKKYESLV